MNFIGAFRCSRCGKEFTLDIGPQKMGELRNVTKISKFIGECAGLLAKSCSEHEKGCDFPVTPWDTSSVADNQKDVIRDMIKKKDE